MFRRYNDLLCRIKCLTKYINKMKIRPSEDVWDRLDHLLNYEEKVRVDFNRTVVLLAFFFLVFLGIYIFMN